MAFFIKNRKYKQLFMGHKSYKSISTLRKQFINGTILRKPDAQSYANSFPTLLNIPPFLLICLIITRSHSQNNETFHKSLSLEK